MRSKNDAKTPDKKKLILKKLIKPILVMFSRQVFIMVHRDSQFLPKLLLVNHKFYFQSRAL